MSFPCDMRFEREENSSAKLPTRRLFALWSQKKQKTFLGLLQVSPAQYCHIHLTQVLSGQIYYWRVSSPQNDNSVINISPSCHSKPIRPSFIFRTQIKIFFIKCESSLALHRQQRNCNVPRPRNVVRTSINSPCKTVLSSIQLCEATRILFERKENKKSCSAIFREYHNAYVRFPQSVNNADYADYVHAHAFPPVT